MKVAVPGYSSVVDEWVALSPENVPKRLSAMTSGQRSAAQNGQKLAPTYSSSGLPPDVSAGPLTRVSASPARLPLPTASRTCAGTEVTSDTSPLSAPPAGPRWLRPRGSRTGDRLHEHERHHDRDHREKDPAADLPAPGGGTLRGDLLLTGGCPA